MSEFNDFFQSIDRLSGEESRKNVVNFLKDQVISLRNEPERVSEVAYSIAGLMATDFARNLNKDDPLDTITAIAGELEINSSDSDELRKELIDAIEAL